MELTKAGSFDGTDMHEHVTAAAIGMDKAITLLGVEPPNSALSHEKTTVERRGSTSLAATIVRQRARRARGKPPNESTML